MVGCSWAAERSDIRFQAAFDNRRTSRLRSMPASSINGWESAGLDGSLPGQDDAERSFGAALSIAREQGTKGFELRAATSLARLWREQGRQDEARELLAPLYGSFTEGFDTSDLKDAAKLLDKLAREIGLNNKLSFRDGPQGRVRKP